MDQFSGPYFELSCEQPLYILVSCKHFRIYASHQRPDMRTFSKSVRFWKEIEFYLHNTTSPADNQYYEGQSQRGHENFFQPRPPLPGRISKGWLVMRLDAMEIPSTSLHLHGYLKVKILLFYQDVFLANKWIYLPDLPCCQLLTLNPAMRKMNSET